MHQRQDLQYGDGQRCSVELWTRVHKHPAPAVSSKDESAGAWG
jgi:hypothetical protein